MTGSESDVVLSYSGADIAVVRDIAKLLRAAGVNVWFDESNIEGGARFILEIGRALETTKSVAIVIGDRAPESWQALEMEVAIEQSIRRGIPIIPVLLRRAPQPSQLPPFLRPFSAVELRREIDANTIAPLVRVIMGEKETIGPPKGTRIARDLANILRSAKDRLTISGHTLDKLSQNSTVREALIDVLNRGVQVTMMQLNPRSLHATAHQPYHELESDSSAWDQHRHTLDFLQNVFGTLSPLSRLRLRVLLTNYMPHFRTVIVDDNAFVYFYMYGTDVDDTPDLALMAADQNDTLRRRLISSTLRQVLAPETIPYIQHGRIYEYWENSKLASWNKWTPEERKAHRITHEFYVTYAAHVHQRVGLNLELEVKAHLELLQGRTLVLGCGSGKEVEYLASKRARDKVIGVDFSSEAIALAKSRLPKFAECFVVGDLYDMEVLFDGTFDSIVANAALVHLLKRDDLKTILHMIWSKLSPDGRVFIRALYKENEVGRPLEFEIDTQDTRWNVARWFVYHSRAELATISRKIGFEVLERETRNIAVTSLGLNDTALEGALSKGFRHNQFENVYWPCILLRKPVPASDTVRSEVRVDALRRAITDDVSKGITQTPVTPLSNLPAHRLPVVGRRDEIENVLNAVQHSTSSITVLSGFGGIGKSTIALEVARRCLEDSRAFFQLVIWVDLRAYNNRSATVDEILTMIADLVDANGNVRQVTDVDRKAALVARLLVPLRSLLVFDNYESVLQHPGRHAELIRLFGVLPLGSGSHTGVRALLTSRILPVGMHTLQGGNGIHEIMLPKLPEQESLTLMQGIHSRVSLTVEQYREIWSLLHGLPKYMQVAVHQLSHIPYAVWLKDVGTVPEVLKGDSHFGDLFAISWHKVLSEDAKQVLMAVTYFEGSASFKALWATTGLTPDRFRQALHEAALAYLERREEDRYSVHPLTHSACSTFLRRADNLEFHRTAGLRFIAYFLGIGQQAHGDEGTTLLESEIRNVVAAATLAAELKEWRYLAPFQTALSSFLGIRGYWHEYVKIMELVQRAAIALDDQQLLASSRVNGLAWLYLRFERLDQAEDCAQQGLSYYRNVDDQPGIAQALRHLGKVALLKGEYDPDPVGHLAWQASFEQANRYYSESLKLRQRLAGQGQKQGEQIADLKLDFGRMLWLRGRKSELAGRALAPVREDLLTAALDNYQAAVKISEDALHEFTDLSITRGTAKALGNLGNAKKEIGYWYSRSQRRDEARRWIDLARAHYEQSIEQARVISRKDELAHGAWGLAETMEWLAEDPTLSPQQHRDMLHAALKHAEYASELYSALAGSYDQETTQRLVARLSDLAQAANVAMNTGSRRGSSESRPALVSWLADRRVSLDGLAPGSALGELARGSVATLPIRANLRIGGDAPLRVLMPICQKVGATGSGVVVREVVDHLARRDVSSLVICGAESGERPGSLFKNPRIDVESVVFGGGQASDLPFPIVGMSDQMPYPSTRFVDLTAEQLEAHLEVWRTRITQAIRRFQPHIIHVHHFWLLAATSAACAGNLPVVVSVHGTDLQQAHKCPHLRELVAPWASRFDRVVALTKESASEVRELFSIQPARISVLGNGFNDELFHPLEAPPHEVLQRYSIGLLAAQRVILFVGKHVDWKGVEWLLHAFAALAARRSDSVLVIGGTGPEAERKRYAELARGLRVEDKVYFTGAVAYDDVGSLMNLASVFVLPSYREPFGLVLLEALACGSRIVATDQGGPAEFVPNQIKASGDAFLVPGLPVANPSPQDTASFVERLANAISVQLDKPQSVENRRRIAASVSRLTWNRYVDDLLALYRGIDDAGVVRG